MKIRGSTYCRCMLHCMPTALLILQGDGKGRMKFKRCIISEPLGPFSIFSPALDNEAYPDLIPSPLFSGLNKGKRRMVATTLIR